VDNRPNLNSAAASAFIKCSSLPELGGRDFPRELTHIFHSYPHSHDWAQGLTIDSDDGVTLVIWGTAEAAVTIMAASVPMLRMLVRGAKSPGRGYHSGTTQSRSRRTYTTSGSSRKVYYNKPRRDLVTMTGSTWTGRSR
jgi:hypothetical protein